MMYLEPARTTVRRRGTRRTPRRILIRRRRAAGALLVGAAAIAGGFGYRSLAASSEPVSPIGGPRSQHGGVLGARLPSTAWPADGQAAVQVGQSQVQAGPNQHAAA